MNRHSRRHSGQGTGFNPQNIQREVPDLLGRSHTPSAQQMHMMMLHAWREAGARVMVEVNTEEEGPLLLNVDHVVALTPTRQIVLESRKLTVIDGKQWNRLMFWFFTGTELNPAFEAEVKT